MKRRGIPGRLEVNVESERVQVLGLYLQQKNHGQVWRIGERKWRGDFRRRMMMFEIMVESVLMREECKRKL
jgi:hypothetical protein